MRDNASAAPTFNLRVEISGLCFYAVVNDGLFALLLNPAEIHSAAHTQHVEHFSDLFVNKHHQPGGPSNGAEDDDEFFRYSLAGLVKWPVPTGNNGILPGDLTNLTERTKCKFDEKNWMKIGNGITAIIPLNLGHPIPTRAPGFFNYMALDGSVDPAKVRLAYKFAFNTPVIGSSFEVELPESGTKLGLHPQGGEVEIRIKNTPEPYRHGKDPESTDTSAPEHFTALYHLLENCSAKVEYPVPFHPDPKNLMSTLITCMGGGGGS
jgi:hypothetical protein